MINAQSTPATQENIHAVKEEVCLLREDAANARRATLSASLSLHVWAAALTATLALALRYVLLTKI